MSYKKRTATPPYLDVLDGSLGLPSCDWENACLCGIRRASHVLFKSSDDDEQEAMCISCLFLNGAEKTSKASCLVCKKVFGVYIAGYASASDYIICTECQPRVLEQAEEAYKEHIESRASKEKKLKVTEEKIEGLKNQLNLE